MFTEPKSMIAVVAPEIPAKCVEGDESSPSLGSRGSDALLKRRQRITERSRRIHVWRPSPRRPPTNLTTEAGLARRRSPTISLGVDRIAVKAGSSISIPACPAQVARFRRAVQ